MGFEFMGFEFDRELNGWYLKTDDGFRAYYDFNRQKYVFVGKIVDSDCRKFKADKSTECVKSVNSDAYKKEV